MDANLSANARGTFSHQPHTHMVRSNLLRHIKARSVVLDDKLQKGPFLRDVHDDAIAPGMLERVDHPFLNYLERGKGHGKWWIVFDLGDHVDVRPPQGRQLIGEAAHRFDQSSLFYRRSP
jgi:hypothetical protein